MSGELTLGGFLDEVCDRHGPREALVFDDPLADGATTRWTYATLRDEARRVGRGLVAAGVEPGETVAVVMANRPEAVAALFGVSLAGGVAALVPTFSPVPELAGMLDRTGARVVLTQARLGRRDLDSEVRAALAGAAIAAVGRDSWADLLDGGDPSKAVTSPAATPELCPADDPDATALVIFTSGTTSEPKGVVHGHRAACLQSWLQAGLFGRHADTRTFAALPLFWTAGLSSMGATLAAGGCWVMQDVFVPGSALDLMARERITEPYVLPHQGAALAEDPGWSTADLSSLRCVYGKGPLARHPTVTPDPGWMMPAGYGLSETCSAFASHRSSTPRAQMRIGFGPLLPGNRLIVRDPDDGRPLPVGEEGELCVAGPTLFHGYLGHGRGEHLDADGHLPTGDLGRIDHDGILHFTGRATEVIRTGDTNVSPAEVEVALRACPGVKQSRVLGMPDDRLGEVVVACIARSGDGTTTADDVRGFLRQRIAPYKVPRHVLFFAGDEIPMTRADTKVRDDDLRALVRDRLGRGGPHVDGGAPDRSDRVDRAAPIPGPTATTEPSPPPASPGAR